MFVGIAKKIWFQRNTVVHGSDFLHPNSIASEAIISDKEYKKTNLLETVLLSENRSGIHSK